MKYLMQRSAYKQSPRFPRERDYKFYLWNDKTGSKSHWTNISKIS